MRTMNGNVNKRQFYPYTIYTRETHENHARNPIFYKIEQKGLSLETFREISTFFAKNTKIPLYDTYESKSRISRRKFNFLQYRAKRAILTTDAGRHPRKKPPMGSRLASSLLSVNACGSSQGESRQDVIFRQKSADLRSESVSGSPG